MRRFEIELDADLAGWVDQAATRNDLTPEELIELLILMESGLGEHARDGRRIGFRAGTYRGYETFLIGDRSDTRIE